MVLRRRAGARVGDDGDRRAGVGGRERRRDDAAVGAHPGQHQVGERPGDRRQLGAPLAEGRQRHHRLRQPLHLGHEVEQRVVVGHVGEGPGIEVGPPAALRVTVGHPARDHGALARGGGESSYGLHDVGEHRRPPLAVRGGEDPLRVDDDQPGVGVHGAQPVRESDSAPGHATDRHQRPPVPRPAAADGHEVSRGDLLHLGTQDRAQADGQRDPEPDERRDGRAAASTPSSSSCRRGGDGVVDVDPRLQVAEPPLEGGERAEGAGQHERVDEVAHDRAGRAAEQHAEHEADEHARDVGQHDVPNCRRDVPHRVEPGDRRTERLPIAPTARARNIDATPMARVTIILAVITRPPPAPACTSSGRSAGCTRWSPTAAR